MPSSAATFRRHAGAIAGVALLVFLVAAPVLWVAGYSLAYSLGGTGLLSDGWTLKNWTAAWGTGGLRASLLYSVVITATVTLLAGSGALGIVLLRPHLRRSAVILAALLLPLGTPSAVMALMTSQVLSPGGFLARLCYHAGLIGSPTQFPALVNDPWSVGMIVAQTSSALPLLTLFFLNAWSAAGADRYCRLAESLGAGRWQARCRVALPMLLRRGRPMILLIFLLNLGSYEIPLLLGRQSPQMFSVLVQRSFGQFDLRQRPQAFVLASIYLLLIGVGVQCYLAWRRDRA